VVRAAALDLLLFELGDPEGRRRFFADQRLRGRADGVLVLSLNPSQDESDMLRRLDVPVVSLGNVIEGFGCVRVDNYGSAASVVRHLINLGHEHIGYIGIADHAAVTPGSRVLAERLAGYEHALKEAGLPQGQALRQFDENTADGGRLAVTRLLSAPVMPTAVFIGSDEMAFGALAAVRSAGLSVPEDLSVAGFDNHAFSDLMHLSTVDQGAWTQGEAAARALLEAIEDPEGEPAELVLPTQLVLRGSTAPPRRLASKPAAEPSEKEDR
jgi:LacI family repressor for deo operon, udp, cdd, tsx, nupC, and nupG